MKRISRTLLIATTAFGLPLAVSVATAPIAGANPCSGTAIAFEGIGSGATSGTNAATGALMLTLDIGCRGGDGRGGNGGAGGSGQSPGTIGPPSGGAIGGSGGNGGPGGRGGAAAAGTGMTGDVDGAILGVTTCVCFGGDVGNGGDANGGNGGSGGSAAGSSGGNGGDGGDGVGGSVTGP